MNLTQVTFFVSDQIAQSNSVSASLLPVPLRRVAEGSTRQSLCSSSTWLIFRGLKQGKTGSYSRLNQFVKKFRLITEIFLDYKLLKLVYHTIYYQSIN